MIAFLVIALSASMFGCEQRPKSPPIKEELPAATMPADAENVGRILPVENPAILGDKRLVEARLLLLAKSGNVGERDSWVVAVRLKNVSENDLDAIVAIHCDGEAVVDLLNVDRTGVASMGWFSLSTLRPGETATAFGLLRTMGNPIPEGQRPEIAVKIESIR